MSSYCFFFSTHQRHFLRCTRFIHFFPSWLRMLGMSFPSCALLACLLSFNSCETQGRRGCIVQISLFTLSRCRTGSFNLEHSCIRSYTQSLLRVLSLPPLGSLFLFSLICTLRCSYMETNRMTWEKAARLTYESRK